MPEAFDPQMAMALMAPSLVGQNGQFDPDAYRQQRMYQGLIGLASGLLSQGGPSLQPTGFGPALGAGFAGMMGAQQAYDRSGLMGAQSANLLSEIGKHRAQEAALRGQAEASGKIEQMLPYLFDAGGGGPAASPMASPATGRAMPGGGMSRGGALGFPAVRDLAQKIGFQGEAADTMAAIVLAESGGDPNAIGDRDIGGSYGLTQIHEPAHGQVARDALGNPTRALQLAYDISKGGTDFTPWTMFKNGGYRKFLPVQQTSGQVARPDTITGDGEIGFSARQDQSAPSPNLPPVIQMPNGDRRIRPDIAQAMTFEMERAGLKIPTWLNKAAEGPIERQSEVYKKQVEMIYGPEIARRTAWATPTEAQKALNAAGIDPTSPYGQGILSHAIPDARPAPVQLADAANLQGPERDQVIAGAIPGQAPTGAMKEAVVYESGAQEKIAALDRANQASRPQTTINNVTNPIAAGIAKRFEDQGNAAMGSVKAIEAMHEARAMLDQGMITGPGTDQRAFLARAGELLGIPAERAANLAAFQSAAGEIVFGLVKNLGTGQSITEGDRKFAERMAGGNADLGEESIRRIFDIRERLARREIQKYQQQVEKVTSLPGTSPDIAALMRIDEPPKYSGPKARDKDLPDVWFSPIKMPDGTVIQQVK